MPSGSEWPQPFSDAARSNSNPAETVLTAAKIAQQRLRPLYSLAGLPPSGDDGCRGILELDQRRPVLASGRLYAFDGREVEARDLATGDLLWRSEDLVGERETSTATTITMAGKSVLVGGWTACPSASRAGGFVLSLDAADGHTRWRESTTGHITRLTVSGTTVVVDGDDTVVDPLIFAAYDVTTGALLWDRGSECGIGADFIVGRRVVSNTACGTVKLATGETTWTKPNSSSWTFFRADGPGVPSRSIYARNPAGAVVALRPNGKTRWNAGEGYGEVLAAGAGQVYVACAGGDSVCALDRLTGEQLWATETRNLVGAVAASDFVVLPGDSSVLRASDGSWVVTLSMAFGTWQSAAVADGYLVRVDRRDIDVYGLRP